MSDKLLRAKEITLSGDKLDNAAAGTTGDILVYLRDQAGKILYASGPDVPVDTSSRYAKGALFIDTNVVSGTTGLYVNVGTSSSSVFKAVSNA